MAKKRVRKIQDPDKLYSFLRPVVDNCLRRSFKEIKYVGLEKIPQDGAVIIAPNHTNALMDALVVLNYDRRPKVFIARADIFKTPIFAKVLKFLKIMPMMRIRDGVSEVKKNDDTIKKSVDVLLDKVPFCILPEGRHRAQHSLLPLGKGIFRVALQTQELLDSKTPLYIVPFGIEYGNFYRFRSTVLVQVGDPIDVRDCLNGRGPDAYPFVMNEMKELLSNKMKEVILYIPDDEYYEATYELCAIMNNSPEDLESKFKTNKETVAHIQEIREKQPEKGEKLLSLADKVSKMRQKSKISLNSVVMRFPFWSRLIKTLILLVALPLVLASAVTFVPIMILSGIVLRKIKDRAFHNSIRYIFHLVVWPLLVLIYTIVFFCTLPWEFALAASLITVPANIIAMDAYKLARILVSDIKLMFNKKLRKSIEELRNLYKQTL